MDYLTFKLKYESKTGIASASKVPEKIKTKVKSVIEALGKMFEFTNSLTFSPDSDSNKAAKYLELTKQVFLAFSAMGFTNRKEKLIALELLFESKMVFGLGRLVQKTFGLLRTDAQTSGAFLQTNFVSYFVKEMHILLEDFQNLYKKENKEESWQCAYLFFVDGELYRKSMAIGISKDLGSATRAYLKVLKIMRKTPSPHYNFFALEHVLLAKTKLAILNNENPEQVCKDLLDGFLETKGQKIKSEFIKSLDKLK